MDLNKEITEKIRLFEQVKTNLGEVSKKIGALTEEQKAIYNQGLELKGAIDVLIALQQKEREDLAKSKTASLILPEGTKPVIPEASQVVEVTAGEPVTVDATTMEVK